MAVAELESPSRCGASGPGDTAEDPEVAELLADARVSTRAGLVGDAYATITLACARLAERTDSVQWARCQVELGEALVTLGRNEEASIVLEQAHLAATALDRPTIGMRAAELAARAALSIGRPDEVQRWLGSLRAAVDRLDDPAARVALAVVEASVLVNQQRYAEGLAIHDAIDRSGLLARTSTSQQLGVRLRAARYRGRAGDSAGAERELAAAAELARALPESHVLVAAAHGVRAQHHLQVGRHEDALSEFRTMLDLASRYRLPDDPNAATARAAIAECLMRLGRFDQALVVADDNVRRARSDDANTIRLPQALLTRGQIQIMKEDFAAAQRDGAAALTLAQSQDGGDEIAAGSWLLLANALRALGRPAEARSHAERAITEFGRMLGPDHPEALGARLALAHIESSVGNFDRASALNLQARDGLVAALGPDHPQVALASYNAGLDLESAGRHEAALVEVERSLAIWRAAFGDDHYEARDAEADIERLRLAIGGRRHRTGKTTTPR